MQSQWSLLQPDPKGAPWELGLYCRTGPTRRRGQPFAPLYQSVMSVGSHTTPTQGGYNLQEENSDREAIMSHQPSTLGATGLWEHWTGKGDLGGALQQTPTSILSKDTAGRCQSKDFCPGLSHRAPTQHTYYTLGSQGTQERDLFVLVISVHIYKCINTIKSINQEKQ